MPPVRNGPRKALQMLSIPISPARLMPYFEVHLSGTDLESAETVKSIYWIDTLNSNIGLELNGVYMSNSIDMFFSGPWPTWAKLSHLPRFELMCEAHSINLPPTILSKSIQSRVVQGVALSPPSGSENVSFRTRKNRHDEKEQSSSGEKMSNDSNCNGSWTDLITQLCLLKPRGDPTWLRCILDR